MNMYSSMLTPPVQCEWLLADIKTLIRSLKKKGIKPNINETEFINSTKKLSINEKLLILEERREALCLLD